MKIGFLIISGSILTISLLFSSCNSEKSPNAGSLPSDSLTIAKGKNSFEGKCNSCHNFDQDVIGPHLAGVTFEQSVDWITNFIEPPKKVIDSGDSTAQKLFKQY